MGRVRLAEDCQREADRNGDGDLTLKEFLGREAEFRKLDANGDGFIEPEESRSADGTK